MSAGLNAAYTFDAFVVGESNRLAVTAARTVGDSPGTSYNPLFIYSSTGLGKTHLLMAIGQRAQEARPGISVEYVTLDEFVEAYHRAVAGGSADAFRREWATRDVLLLDDVQFLSHSKEMQSELLRLAVEFQGSEKQLVMTSDRPPAEIEQLEARLLQQLAGGLVVDIGVPEFETRLAILRMRAGVRGTQLSEEVLHTVAEFDVQHVRGLLGILNRLQAYQSMSDAVLTPPEARSIVLGQMPDLAAQTGQPQKSDEFGDFLSGLTETVTEQVQGWMAGSEQTVQRLAAEGFDTSSLEGQLDKDAPTATAALKAFEERVERLKQLRAQMADLDPEGAEDPVFMAPQRIDEAEERVRRTRIAWMPPDGPSDAYALDAFVGSDSTRMAIEAVRAVLAEPAKRYNPLVIVGGAGMGKTHLLNALGRSLREVTGGIVACLSAEKFTNELVKAIEQNRVGAWRAKYRRAQALLLDDIEKVAAKPQSQEELFNLFNQFAEAGRQLAFTASQVPESVGELEDRLRSRLMGGLVTNLDAPDESLRRAIVQNALRESGSSDPGLIEYLVQQQTESVRGLLNIVERVVSGVAARGVPATASAARELLEGTAEAAARPSDGAAAKRPPTPVAATGIRSREKFVWAWPDPVERLIEDLA